MTRCDFFGHKLKRCEHVIYGASPHSIGTIQIFGDCVNEKYYCLRCKIYITKRDIIEDWKTFRYYYKYSQYWWERSMRYCWNNYLGFEEMDWDAGVERKYLTKRYKTKRLR